MIQRAIVTGGAGFVGAHLARKVQIDHGAEVLVVDDFRTGTFANLNPDEAPAEPFTVDLIATSLNDVDLSSLVAKFQPDVIFHEASITDTTVEDEATMLRDNVDPFRTLLDVAVKQHVRLVRASSAATYGRTASGAVEHRRPFREADAGNPANVYGFSKWVMENLHRRTLATHPEAHIVGLRYFNVFGPVSYTHLTLPTSDLV